MSVVLIHWSIYLQFCQNFGQNWSLSFILDQSWTEVKLCGFYTILVESQSRRKQKNGTKTHSKVYDFMSTGFKVSLISQDWGSNFAKPRERKKKKNFVYEFSSPLLSLMTGEKPQGFQVTNTVY